MNLIEILKNDNLSMFIENYNEEDFFKDLDLQEKDKKSKVSRNFLHRAVEFNAPKIVKYILEKYPEIINSRDIDGNTALHIGVIKNSLESLDVLLKAEGVDVNAMNKSSKSTPISFLGLKKDQSLKDNILKMFLSTGLVNEQLNQDLEDKFKEIKKSLISLADSAEQITSSVVSSNKAINDNSENNKPRKTVTQEDGEEQVIIETSEEAISYLKELGFEILNETTKKISKIEGREKTANMLEEMIEKNQNIVVVAPDGSGKTTLVSQIAQSTDKTIIRIPSEFLKGSEYSASTNKKIKQWLSAFLKVDNAVLFVDDMEVLLAGETASGKNDTPVAILKEFMEVTRNPRLQIIGTLNTTNYLDFKKKEEGFLRRFANGTNGGTKLEDMPLEEIKSIMLSDTTIKNLENEGLKISDKKRYEGIMELSLKYLNNFIFNEKFPYKAFEFTRYLLSKYDLEELDKKTIQNVFSEKYNVPLEYVSGELSENSKFLSLETALKKDLKGQDPALEGISKIILDRITTKTSKDRKPINLFLVGPTGVGKSEATKIIASHLGYPKIEINCAEYQTPHKVDELIEELKKHIKNNYSGIIVFEEIEKGTKKVIDLLLGLGEGRIGSGEDLVMTGNQIIALTSNVAADNIAVIKQQAKDLGMGEFALKQETLIQIMLNQDFARKEIFGRINLIAEFSPIFEEQVKEIAINYINKKRKEQAEDHEVNISVSETAIDFVLKREFNEEENHKSGVRGVLKIIDKLLGNLYPTNEAKLLKRPGTSIEIDIDKTGNLISKITLPGEKTKEFLISAKDEKTKEEKTDEVINSLPPELRMRIMGSVEEIRNTNNEQPKKPSRKKT